MKLLLRIVTIAILAMTAGCGKVISHPPHNICVLADMTVTTDQIDQIKSSIATSVADWAENAEPGDTYDVYVLTPKSSDGPAKRAIHETFPRLVQPTKDSRPIFVKKTQDEIGDALAANQQSLAGVKGSPILEGMGLIADQHTGTPYVLTVYTDLLQESSDLSLSYWTGEKMQENNFNSDVEPVVEKMLTTSRYDRLPQKPTRAVVRWTYGKSKVDGVSLEHDRKVRLVWEKFLDKSGVAHESSPL